VRDGLPFAVEPRKKLDVAAMREILSDHLEGTGFDRTDGHRLGSPHDVMTSDDGMICSQAFQEAAVFQLRGWLPPEVGCVYWRTTGAPCSGVLTPWYAGITETPAIYRKYRLEENVRTEFHFDPPPGTFEHDPGHAFWIFNTLENLVDLDHAAGIAAVRPVWEEFERRELALQPAVESCAVQMLEDDRDLAREYLTRYSCGLALQAVARARGLIQDLRTELFGY
jgi:dipeptidase